jgi:hypothetical protein
VELERWTRWEREKKSREKELGEKQPRQEHIKEMLWLCHAYSDSWRQFRTKKTVFEAPKERLRERKPPQKGGLRKRTTATDRVPKSPR